MTKKINKKKVLKNRIKKIEKKRRKKDTKSNFNANVTPNLSKDKLSHFSPIHTAAAFSSLLLEPRHQANQYLIETIISECLTLCKGTKRPSLKTINSILESFSFKEQVLSEDSVEDVFISKIWFEDIPYKVCTGLHEGGIYQLQIFCDLVANMPFAEDINNLKNSIKAVLIASDQIITRNNLLVYTVGGMEENNKSIFSDSKLDSYINKIKVDEFINIELLPCLNLNEISPQTSFIDGIDKTPFIKCQEGILLLLSSSIIICIKKLIIEFFNTNRSIIELDKLYFKEQCKKISNIKILGKLSDTVIIPRYILNNTGWKVADTVAEFDQGYLYHFIFIFDSMRNILPNWFHSYEKNTSEIEIFVGNLINKTKESAIKNKNTKKGCSIIVLCGYGRPMMYSSEIKNEDSWMIESTNSHDLDTLSKYSACSPHKVWRVIESVEKLEKIGFKIFNLNGFLNLFAYAKNNNYCIISYKNFQGSSNRSSNVVVHLPSNCQAKLREEVLYNNNEMLVNHPTLGLTKVTRRFVGGEFTKNPKFHIYCPSYIDNIMRSIYIKDSLSLWIETELVENIPVPFQCVLYESVLSWFGILTQYIQDNNIFIPKNIICWKIVFKYPDDYFESLEKKIDLNLVDFCYQYEFDEDTKTLFTYFNQNLIYGLRLPTNNSEKAITRSFLSFLSEYNLDIDIEKTLNKIIKNNDARFMHGFKSEKYRAHFNLEQEEPIYIEDADQENIKIGLGWNIRQKEQGNKIVGKDACKEYLRELVAFIWSRLRTSLRDLDRNDLISKLIFNIECLEQQKERWLKTSKANVALHDYDETITVLHKMLPLLNGALLSSRLIIEMAICESPIINGKKAGKLDIQELMCLAMSMHQYGGLSEAINYEAILPEIVISSFGDILFDSSFIDKLMPSYFSRINKSQVNNSISDYENNFSTKEYDGNNITELFDNRFNEAWLEEFGFTLDDAKSVIHLLAKHGLSLNQVFYSITSKELLSLFPKEQQNICDKVIDALTIYSRDSWQTIPKPYKKEDWQPWKFRRRFSLAMKPIIKSSDDKFIISPQLIINCFLYLLYSCYEASIDENHFVSKKMKQWIGSIRSENGLQFNTEIANKLTEKGWIVRSEIKITEILNKKLDKDYGDVDVFAWNKETGRVLVIECKDLEFAKTQGEIARQLHEFKGQLNHKGKQDRLLKHISRIDIINENLSNLAKFTGINSTINIEGYVITSRIVPMLFAKSFLHQDKIKFLALEDIIDNAMYI